MKVDLFKEKQKAIDYFEKLLKKNAVIELREIKQRTTQQNKYLHLIIGWFAIEYGDNLEYCKKHFFKYICNKNDYLYEKINKKTGEIRKELRSITEFDTAFITKHIERFRNYSAKQGIYLPTPEEKDKLNYIEIEIEKNKTYI